jgi:hypothetical protein
MSRLQRNGRVFGRPPIIEEIGTVLCHFFEFRLAIAALAHRAVVLAVRVFDISLLMTASLVFLSAATGTGFITAWFELALAGFTLQVIPVAVLFEEM